MFEVERSVRKGSQAKGRAKRSLGAARGSAIKILVIDDNHSLSNSVAKILTGAGHDVVVADDGEQGLTLFRADCPDLVICDLVMPNRDGIFVITQIRREASATKIIAMSGGGNVTSLATALDSGADEIIAKPFDAASLLDAVRSVCP